MGSDADTDRVRLTVPADPAMVDVVRAAVRSLCARVGLREIAIEATRASVGKAFLDLLEAGDDTVRLEATVAGTELVIALAAGGETRHLTASS